MKLDDLMGYVVDRLYDGLTGGTADLPLPSDVQLNFIQPGMPFHESFFNFAVAGPFAGPTPATLDDFRNLMTTLMGEPDPDADTAALGDAEPRGMGMDREAAIEEAKRMYLQAMLGSWEQWSRLVDKIPLPQSRPMEWSPEKGAGKHKHISVVYAQNNRNLSDVYADTLRMCEMADDDLTDEQKRMLERLRAILGTQREVPIPFTDRTTTEFVPSPVMAAYKVKQQAYEDRVIEYATKLSQSNNGDSADLIAWQQTGGIYKRRATEALRDWIANGYKNDIERAQAQISHITGRSMVQWKEGLLEQIKQIEMNTTGTFGYPFPPATVIPGDFAQNEGGWSRFSERSLTSKVSSSTVSRSGRVSFLGLSTFGGSVGGGATHRESTREVTSFGMEFSHAAVEIMRPWFHPGFLLSRGWRPTAAFEQNYLTDRHSDGKSPPSGAMIGYPSKALFVRDLVIHSSEVTDYVKSKETHIGGGGFIGIGPFCIGGSYQQANRSSERTYSFDGNSIMIHGLQLVGFLSTLLPECANPSPDVEKWT